MAHRPAGDQAPEGYPAATGDVDDPRSRGHVTEPGDIGVKIAPVIAPHGPAQRTRQALMHDDEVIHARPEIAFTPLLGNAIGRRHDLAPGTGFSCHGGLLLTTLRAI